MRLSLPTSLAVAACLALAPARATSEYQYRKNEYVIVRDGLAPNKQLAVAAHGPGENNDDAFHIWLMAEPAHRRLVPLANIKDDLDSAADAFHAFWSKDSRHVGVAHRADRHEAVLDLYLIDGRRAHRITGPSLFKEVTSREATDDDGLRQRNAIVEWKSGNRFVLREFKSFVAADDSLMKLLGKYGSIAEKMEDGQLFIQFIASAECELLPGNRYRVIDLTPGKPGDADDWWQGKDQGKDPS
jgi:hypothetical protein